MPSAFVCTMLLEPPSDACAVVDHVIVPAESDVQTTDAIRRRSPWPGSARVERVRMSQIEPGISTSALPPVIVVASDVAESVMVPIRPVPSPSSARFSCTAHACPALSVSRVTADAFEWSNESRSTSTVTENGCTKSQSVS